MLERLPLMGGAFCSCWPPWFGG